MLAELVSRDQLAEIIFAETSTNGIRFHPVSRLKLARKAIEVETRFGRSRGKVSGEESNPTTITAEYEDCQQLPRLNSAVPLKLVMEEAQAAARRILKP